MNYNYTIFQSFYIIYNKVLKFNGSENWFKSAIKYNKYEIYEFQRSNYNDILEIKSQEKNSNNKPRNNKFHLNIKNASKYRVYSGCIK